MTAMMWCSKVQNHSTLHGAKSWCSEVGAAGSTLVLLHLLHQLQHQIIRFRKAKKSMLRQRRLQAFDPFWRSSPSE
jgi:hypothetical protein